jgi:hypothetical protein
VGREVGAFDPPSLIWVRAALEAGAPACFSDRFLDLPGGVFSVHYPRTPGLGRESEAGPVSRPETMGVRSAGIPLSYVTARGCHGYRGAAQETERRPGGPQLGPGFILLPTTGGLCDRPQHPGC